MIRRYASKRVQVFGLQPRLAIAVFKLGCTYFVQTTRGVESNSPWHLGISFSAGAASLLRCYEYTKELPRVEALQAFGLRPCSSTPRTSRAIYTRLESSKALNQPAISPAGVSVARELHLCFGLSDIPQCRRFYNRIPACGLARNFRIS